MTLATNAASNDEASTDLQLILGDMAQLKQGLAALVGRLKPSAGNVIDDVTRQVEEFGDQAAGVYDGLAAQGQRSAKAMSRQVEENPIMSLLLAFGIGFIGGRLLAR